MLTKNGKKFEDVIKKAIDDHVITTSEYEEIMAIALEDAHIDVEEKLLLSRLRDMVKDKKVKRIP